MCAAYWKTVVLPLFRAYASAAQEQVSAFCSVQTAIPDITARNRTIFNLDFMFPFIMSVRHTPTAIEIEIQFRGEKKTLSPSLTLYFKQEYTGTFLFCPHQKLLN